ncbi:carboxyl-terminal processing protease CtpA [Leptolyngbya sp. PCC 6406]|uniref:carboxyl-terminal processing protease CtpA n=1 Tax=Leptolyngbya sp. PCC 6406 TaxID=1173264 RepID=UPI00047FE7B8|nr:carboxyl-terminal processing protease CtpA [Leptolyngbya sp. PCC 6406]
MGKYVVRGLSILMLVAGLWLGWGSQPAYALTDEHQLLSEVWRIVNRAYIDESFNHQNWWFVRQRWLQQPLETREETYGAIDEMLATLGDPYTRLLPPEQYRSLQTSTSGELTGVGLQIAKDEQDGTLQVVAPVEGSPAAAAGLQPRDRILSIDNVATTTLTLDEAAQRMRGPLGSTVVLTVLRPGGAAPSSLEQPVEQRFELKRDRISLNPVTVQFQTLDNGLGIGYIRLSQFNANAVTAVAQAIKDLEAQGANAYVLDLRNNPGGLLTAGIEIARQWLEEGTIVYTVDRQGVLDSYTATGAALTQAPLAVLVNEGTASASEILAGALQDNQRAVLVGGITFGKGLIQSLFDLSDGSGLVVTVAKYETPAHHDINRSGIRPDQRVSLAPLGRDQVATAADTQYQAAVELLTQRVAIARVS